MRHSIRPAGHCCPDCRVPMDAELVRETDPGVRLRARVCPVCGNTIKTCERPVRGGAKLLAKRSGFRCRSHPSVPMHTTDVRRVGCGIVVRYLQCPACEPGGYVCQRGPPRPGVPQVRTEEREVRDGCTTPLALLAQLCQSG